MNVNLAWLALSWFLTSLVGALVGAFGYGLAIGKWKAHVDAEIDAARKSREAIHRALDKHDTRFERGDAKFEKHLEQLSTLSSDMSHSAESMGTLSATLSRTIDKLVTPDRLDGAIAQHRIDCPAAALHTSSKTG